MRLDKLISHCGYGSRKEVKEILKKENVEVNGKRVKDGKFNVNESSDNVTLNGEVLEYQKYFYYMLHKPEGVISATEDNLHKTVLDLLTREDYRDDLFPVGRLDKDTTGLLILTNDGQLSHNLLSPKKHVSKCYHALIEGIVTKEDVAKFKEGLIISGDEECMPGYLTIVSVDEEMNQSRIEVVISEGKYHQVKRMFEAVGKKVLTLHRQSMGGLVLDENLSKGSYRKVTAEELELLQKPKV